MMKALSENYFIEVDHSQTTKKKQIICGDVFLSRKIKDENRLVMVLSDGLGSGVKANVLATLTASMAINYASSHKDIKSTADVIMNTLPVCSKRKISYAAFTIIDIEWDGMVKVIYYDTPEPIILRDAVTKFNPRWQNIVIEDGKKSEGMLKWCQFPARKEDRIIFMTDGVNQSGMGSRNFPFGWGDERLHKFIKNRLSLNNSLSAHQLSTEIVKRAGINDGNQPKDDTSCAVVYFREPRKLLITTGPPYDEKRDRELAGTIKNYAGKKIICGGTTAGIVSRELERKIKVNLRGSDPELPPASEMEGIDLVTEGILTIGKVARILEQEELNITNGNGPADKIVKLLLGSDIINLVVGTKVNIAHQDPSLPVELEIRRTVIKKIASLLENKYLKEVDLKFI